MRNGKIGWGIIGYGVIGPHHAKAATNAPGAELVAVCDIDPARETKLREGEYDVPFYASHQEMFDHEPDLDAVSVCTPSGLHHQGAIAAAERGINVLSEKPLDIVLKNMDAMINACADAGVKLGCIFQKRTQPDYILAKKALDKGMLGQLVLGDCYQKYYRSPAYYKSAGWRGTWELDGGGALMNQAVHGIDSLLWLMGDVESVFSYSGTLLRDIEVEDTSISVVRFKNGAFGNVIGTTSVVPGQGCKTEIHGDHGTIRIGDGPLKCWTAELVDGAHKPEEIDLAQVLGGQNVDAENDGGPTVASDNTALSSDGHTIQVQDMCDAIVQDRDPMVPGPDARRAVELICAIYESWRTGAEVKLPLGG